MKIVVADVDGTLNSRQFFIDRCGSLMGFGKIDLKCIDVLNEIHKQVPYKVVISSSWRNYWSLSEIKTKFAQLGLVAEVIDVTPSLYIRRGLEVSEWLNKANDKGMTIEGYCCIDDVDDFECMPQHFIEIDYNYGLLPIHIPKIVKILNNEYNS